MGLYRTEAIVLRSRKYLETDSLLTLLTTHKGKVGAIAKGVRKPSSRLRGGVQVFTHNEMLLYQGRNLDIVSQSTCLESFTLLQEDMLAMTAACYWSELLDALIPEGEVDLGLFQLALAGYHSLSLAMGPLMVRGLEIRLLSYLGYMPCLEHCVNCKKDLKDINFLHFSVRYGGIICPDCGQNQVKSELFAFSHEALNAWQQLEKMDLSKISRLKISARGVEILNTVMNEFLLRQLDYPLKSASVLKALLKEEQE